MDPKKREQFRFIFYPNSIAVVGASEDERKAGGMYLKGLLDAGFKGQVYPINPGRDRIKGLKAYPKVSSIPDSVDYIIVTIPRQLIPELLEDCALKRVKVVHMFTAGFSETGEEEGQRLEAGIATKAREAGIRIIGPNCIGVYCPAQGMPYAGGKNLGEAGSTAFISQSGSVAVRLIEDGLLRGIKFSKVVSFGNGCDLDSTDYLEYLAVDPETEVIGAYLEGVRDGHRLWQLSKEISRKKPLVIWKGGRTEAGAEAAFSHTAALAGSELIWKAALKQAGAIQVENVEQMTDTILGLQFLPPLQGGSVALIAGLVDGGGGTSVAGSDACAGSGLNVPSFSQETKNRLRAILPSVGSILRNPLDVSQARADVEILSRAIREVTLDPGIELIMIEENVYQVLEYTSKEKLDAINDLFLALKQKKPLVMVLLPGSAPREEMEVKKRFAAAQIPVYPSLERAAKATANVALYWKLQHEREE